MELVLKVQLHILQYNETAGAQWGVKISTAHHLIEDVNANKVAFGTQKCAKVLRAILMQTIQRWKKYNRCTKHKLVKSFFTYNFSVEYNLIL